jgi:CheY-like chemotaxis protein
MIENRYPTRRRLPCSVLVVDDHDEVRGALRLVLEHFGFAVRDAATGLDALALAQASRPRIVLLDMVLPEIDGQLLARMLRADPMTRHAALVATSASAAPETRTEALSAGCDEFLVKPIEPLHLVATVRAYARRRPGYDLDPLDESGLSARALGAQPHCHATSPISDK